MSLSPLSNAVLMREATRNSRRWQMYGARMAFSGLLMGSLLLGIWLSVTFGTKMMGSQSAELSWLAKTLFVVFTVFQTLLALVMTPLMVSRAIIEERTDKTIELMVLTPIRVRHLLISKIASQIMSILLIILGSLPIMGMVLSLGGVGVDELVVITMGIVVTVVLMGALSSFFGMFTESPFIATIASLFWAISLFVLLPLVHGLMSASWRASAQISPFFSNLGNWWGLLICVAYLPITLLTVEMASRMFDLRVSNAEFRHYLSMKQWLGKPMFILFICTLLLGIVVVPLSIGLSWWSATSFGAQAPTFEQIQSLPGPAIGGAVGRVLSLCFTSTLGVLATWVYLRLAMDFVDILNGIKGGGGTRRSRKKRSVGHKIWSNPILWRESRMSGLGGTWVIMASLWLIIMLFLLQSGVWVVPGGLLSIGLLNSLGAVGLAVWIAAGSFEQERRGQTLTLLMMTSMNSWRIVMGKTVALAGPSLPFLLIGGFLILVGQPYLEVWKGASAEYEWGLLRGFWGALWWGPVWFVFTQSAMILGLRMKRKGVVYSASIALVGLCIGVPAFMAWIFREVWLVAVPARLISAGLMPWATVWEQVLSIGFWSLVALILHIWLVSNLRRWGGHVDG